MGKLFYLIGQGFKNIKRNSLFSLASIGTITACLFMFGIFFCIVTNFRYMVGEAQNNVGVTVFFDADVKESRILEIQKEIEKHDAVDSTVYISAEQAWENFKDQYFADGDQGILDGLDDDNPLADSASIEVYLSDTSRQNELVSYIEKIDGVDEVNASEIIADSFTSFSKLVGYVSLAIILILVLVAIFLINNTVTMGITIRKDEIAIMRYIGATERFIRAPFVIEGLVIGLIGSIIPIVLLYTMYPVVVSFVLGHFSLLNRILTFMSVEQVFVQLIPISLVIGLGIGFIGSTLTLRKHVRV